MYYTIHIPNDQRKVLVRIAASSEDEIPSTHLFITYLALLNNDSVTVIVFDEIAQAPKYPRAPLLRFVFGFAGVDPKIGIGSYNIPQGPIIIIGAGIKRNEFNTTNISNFYPAYLKICILTICILIII